jgi:hypothetical protein
MVLVSTCDITASFLAAQAWETNEMGRLVSNTGPGVGNLPSLGISKSGFICSSPLKKSVPCSAIMLSIPRTMDAPISASLTTYTVTFAVGPPRVMSRPVSPMIGNTRFVMGSVNEVSGPDTGRTTNRNRVAVDSRIKVNARLVPHVHVRWLWCFLRRQSRLFWGPFLELRISLDRYFVGSDEHRRHCNRW